MHLKIALLIVLTISLVGITQLDTVDAATHNFHLEWGNAGIKTPGSFLSPQHLALDSENNVYVTDLGNARVQKFDPNGNFLTEWGSKGTEPGQFGHPSGIAISDEFVFVVDNRNHNIQKFDLDGNHIITWGEYGKSSGSLNSPRGITISDDKFLYVVDNGNARIQKFTLNGEYVSEFGQSGKRGGGFINPVDIVINSEQFFVTDPAQNKIIVFDMKGNFKKEFNDSFGGLSINPEGIVFDSYGNFYIVDYKNNRIIHYNDMFVPLSVFGNSGNAEGEFRFPKDVAMSSDGYLFVTDTQGHRIQKFVTPSTQLPTIEDESSELKPNLESESITFPPVDPVPNDFKKPTILVPEDVLVEASGPLTIVNIGEAMATDESGIHSLSNNAPTSFPLGINTIIWTAVDGAGNMAIASQTITIQDTTPPKISSLKNITLEAKSSERNLVTIDIPKITDEVGVLSITNDAPEVFPLGETIVTWTATDVIGNISTQSQSIQLIDTVSPRIAFTDNIILEASSLSENTTELIIPEYSDEVGVLSITNDAPEVFPLGETIVTWTATDSSGNISSMTQTITFIDEISPVITTNDQILEATISGGTNLTIEIPIVDDIQDTNITNDAPEVFPLGETIVTWTATDSSGNSASATQTITVVDTTVPVLIVPESLKIEAQGISTTIEDFGDIIAEDISGITSITNDAPEVFPLGETIVTWTATDDFGNSVSNTQSIMIVDTTLPIIAAPSDLQIEASHTEQNIVDLTGVRVSDLVEVSSITNDAPEVFSLGETIVTWTATDSSGNSASTTQTITVVDTTVPIITTPSDIEIEIIDNSGMKLDIGAATSDDTVDLQPLITNDAPEVFPLGETIVTWTATDSSGNSASATQTITVVDTTAPVLISPESVTREAINNEANPVRIGMSEAIDIVEVSSITNDAPEVFPLGETIVTWTATDSSGNSASATQTITVVDTTAPVIEQPENVISEAENLSNNTVELQMIVSSDNTEIISITNDAPSFFEFGTTIVTWTATDIIGNQSTILQDVQVVDTTLPTIFTPSNVQVEATSMESTIVDYGFAQASDQIEVSSITNDAPEVFPLGETIVTWTATDSSGNSASATQTITVVDTTAPVIEQPENIIFNATSKSKNVVDLQTLSAIDSISTVKITNDAPSYYLFGETIVTWTATDSSGNSASATQTITVVDTTAPTLNAPQNITIDTESIDTVLEIGLASVNDIIDDAPSITNDAPEVFPLGETIVTWTATDKFGNTSLSTQTISLKVCGNSPSYYNMIVGTDDDDLLIGTTMADLIFAKAGDDIISADKGNDCIIAGDGDDIIFGNEGNDHISGQGGNDILKGNSGEDVIIGGNGLDVIDGGEDIDTCKIIDERNRDIVIRCELDE